MVPGVHALACFPGIAPLGRKIAPALRQLLNHEMDMEVIRRAEAVRRGVVNGACGVGTGHSVQSVHLEVECVPQKFQ